MRIYFVRHGESEANVLYEFSNRNHESHPLTAKGREQAEELAKRLRETEFSEIYTSPLLRARQTAEIIGAGRDVPVQVTPALREHEAGEFEGRHDKEAWDAYQTIFESWLFKQDFEARPPNGESFNEMRERFIPFVKGVVEKHAGSDANVLMVAHGGIYHALLPVLVTNVGYAFAYKHILGNAALVLVEIRDEALYCVEWAGMSLESEQNAI